MDTVTYPEPRVAHFIMQHFVPARVRVKENRGLVDGPRRPATAAQVRALEAIVARWRLDLAPLLRGRHRAGSAGALLRAPAGRLIAERPAAGAAP